jgi:lipoprotein-anchoring transpeptidase ErfK/SrfK
MNPGRAPFPAAAARALARHGIRPARYFLTVDIARQTTTLFERRQGIYRAQKIFRCSTSRFGVGEQSGSQKTPRGLHRIAEKVGGGWPVGAAFKSRRLIGFTWQGRPFAPIAHRILWLEGLEPGLNRGGEVDSYRRYIYIHGTGNETTLGRPDSSGCVQLSSGDLLPLYDLLPVGTLVWIAEGGLTTGDRVV